MQAVGRTVTDWFSSCLHVNTAFPVLKLHHITFYLRLKYRMRKIDLHFLIFHHIFDSWYEGIIQFFSKNIKTLNKFKWFALTALKHIKILRVFQDDNKIIIITSTTPSAWQHLTCNGVILQHARKHSFKKMFSCFESMTKIQMKWRDSDERFAV